MRDIDSVDTRESGSIELYTHRALHHIPDRIVTEPAIHEDTHCLTTRIRDIDEELSMSEGCDNHRYYLQKNGEKAIKKSPSEDGT